MKTTENRSVKEISESEKTPQTKITEHPFLRTLSLSHLEILGQGALEITFQPGEVIFGEGEPANRFYLVEEGQLALEAHAPNRGDILIQKISKGDVLGWSWLFPPFVWHFQARALDQTTVIALNGARLLVSCEENHDFGYELMKRVAQVVIQRLEATWQKVLDVHPPASTPPIQTTGHKPEQHFNLETAITRHPFLADMSAAHLKLLCEQAMHARFEADKVIFAAGDPANRFYAIEQGQIAVESDSASGPLLVQMLGDGDVLGWSWLYPPYYSHFSARALQATSAVFFYGTRLRETCEADHELGYELIKRTTRVVIHRLQATRRQLLEPLTNR